MDRTLADREGDGEFRIPIWAIFILALAVRALALLRTDPVAFDSAVYFEMAALIRAGHWAAARAFDFPPLYPALVAAVQSLGISAAAAGLFVSLAADLLAMLPLVAIARAAAGEAAAWAAAFLWAIHPYAVRLGVQALSDAPTALFVGLAIWAGLRAMDSGRIGWALGAGAASGLAYLARPEGIEPALALAALYAGEGRKAKGQRPAAWRRAAWALAPLLGWAVVASPYIAAISADAGSLTLSKKKSPAALMRSLASPIRGQRVASTGPAGIPPPKVQAPSALRPSRLPDPTRKGYLFERPLVNGVHPLVLALAGLGAFVLRRAGPPAGPRARALLAGLCGLHLVALIALAASRGPGYLGGHHFFLAAFYLLPFAGAALARAIAWGTDRLRSPRVALALSVVLLAAVMVPQSALRGPDRGTALRPAADWIRAQAPGGAVVVTDLAKLTYHAGAARVELLGTYEEVLRRGRAQGAQFVAFYPDKVTQRSPDFLSKLNPADLELARAFPEPARGDPNRRVEVYRLKTQ